MLSMGIPHSGALAMAARLGPLLSILRDTRDVFNENVLFGVGVLLLASFFAGKLAQKVSLPSVSGYIVAGLLLGPPLVRYAVFKSGEVSERRMARSGGEKR